MTGRVIIAMAIAAALAAPLEFRGQEKRDASPRVSLRVDSTLVLVPVEVNDENGRPIAGLEKENFKVYDDKVEQQITSFAREEDPIAICLVFDVSSSMARGDMRDQRIQAQYFFKTANPGDEYCVVVLASEAKLAIPLSENAGSVDSEILFARAGGSTALLDGIYLGMNELRKSKKLRKALIVISDGGDNNSRYTETEVRRALRESDVLIYAVGDWGAGLDSAYGDMVLLKDLTKDTGGRMVVPTQPGDAAVFDFADKVLIDLRNRYVLAFAPTNAARDGSYHRLEVKLAPPKGLPKLRAHWKAGYYAPTE